MGLLALRFEEQKEKKPAHVISETELRTATDDICSWRECGIHTIGLADPRYPAQLKEIHNPPPVLFYRGAHPENATFDSCVSIVGSRRAEQYSCELAYDFASELVLRQVSIVSGLALGVDGAAHRGALTSTGEHLPTIAILGNGLHRTYPSSHERLADQILDYGGTILSQFEPGVQPYPSNFLNRNRIISGFSLATIVIEAGERSGSLVTARYALEQGREVFSVPGLASGKRYRGSNGILRQGAVPVRDIADVLEDLPQLAVKKVASDVPQVELSCGAQFVVEQLNESGEISLEKLRQRFSQDADFASCILELELQGCIVHTPGQKVVATAVARRYC
jgi:DNA processing protein